MNTYLTLVTLALSLQAGQVLAESEGNGDPFAFRAGPFVVEGQPFVNDTWTAAYPSPAGTRERPSDFGLVEPVTGAEMPVQTAQSLPLRSGEGSLAYAQAESASRYFSLQARLSRVQMAGKQRPRG